MGKNRKNRSGRNCDGAEITFKPIGNGRVVCEQTGVVLGRGKTGGYRRSRFNEAHIITMPSHGVDPSGGSGMGKIVESSFKPLQSSFPTASIDRNDNSAQCPHCYNWNFNVSLGARRCSSCDKRFEVTR